MYHLIGIVVNHTLLIKRALFSSFTSFIMVIGQYELLTFLAALYRLRENTSQDKEHLVGKSDRDRYTNNNRIQQIWKHIIIACVGAY